MTTDEFSNSLDALLNSYNLRGDFGEGSSKMSITLDEYEKSVLLTQAQNIIVKSYFDRTLNSQEQGFDDTAGRQVDFSSLIKVKRYTPLTDTEHYDDRGLSVKLEPNVLYVLSEKLEVTSGNIKKIFVVVPINYREYDRLMSKAYGQPLKRQAWRLFSNSGTGYDIKSEIIPSYDSCTSGDVLQYVIRYVERPTPIVLTDFTDDSLSIDGVKVKTECSLNPKLHYDILQRAFELAIATRGGGTVQRRQNDNDDR